MAIMSGKETEEAKKESIYLLDFNMHKEDKQYIELWLNKVKENDISTSDGMCMYLVFTSIRSIVAKIV